MKIFYETVEKFKNFSSIINIKMQQFTPYISILENISNSYDKVLTDDQKNKNKNYIEIKNRLESINQEINNKQEIIKQLTDMFSNFENEFNKKYSELELKAISQKAFIRIKEQEFENYINSYEIKLKERQKLEENKSNLQLDINNSVILMDEECRQYIEDVKIKNVEYLKTSVLDISEKFNAGLVGNSDLNSDYINSEEYANSTQEFKETYKKLYLFMTGLFDITQRFIDDSNFEKILPDLLEIQNIVKEKYNEIDKIDIQKDKLSFFESLKEKYETELKNSKGELENILNLADKDEELLEMKTEIENFINQHQIN